MGFPFEVFRNSKAQHFYGRYDLNTFTIDKYALENVIRGKTYTKLLAFGFLQLGPIRRRKPVVSPYIPSLGILSGGITNSWQLPRYNLPVHFLVVIINCLANWTPIQQRQSYADSVPTSLPLLPSVEWCHNMLPTMQHFRLHATPLFIASWVGSDISLSSLEFDDVGSAIFPIIVELITIGTANQIIQWSLVTGAQAPDSKSRTNVHTVDERNAFKRHKDVSKNLHLPYYQWGNVQNFKNSRSFLK